MYYIQSMARQLQDILVDFIDIITQQNPANFPNDVLTTGLVYDVEALSILSRFAETAVHVPNEESEILPIAESIIKQTFDYWYNKQDMFSDEIASTLASKLLKSYRASIRS